MLILKNKSFGIGIFTMHREMPQKNNSRGKRTMNLRMMGYTNCYTNRIQFGLFAFDVL